MKFHCPHCQQKLDAPPEYSGMVINCPSCQGQIQVPTQTTPPQISISRPSAAAPPPLPPLSISRPSAVAPMTAPPSHAAQTTAAPTEFPDAAPLIKRIAAKILDYIFQVAIMTGMYYGGHQLAVMESKHGVSRGTIAIIGICIFVLWLLVPFLYNYLPLAGSGATMGKKMLGLVVVRQNRQPLGYAWALLRVLTEYVCVGACYGVAVAIFIGLVRLQMHGGGTGTQFTPPRMPPIHQPGTPFVPPRPPSPASAANAPLKLLLTMPVFLLTFVPYIPAFFTKGRRATHDLIVRTLVISR